MTTLFSDKLVIIISHRLFLTKDADTIILMDNGFPIEIGTHDELLSMNGHYANMWNVQSEKYINSYTLKHKF